MPSVEEIDALAELFERADLVTLRKVVKGEDQVIGLGLGMRRLIANSLRAVGPLFERPEQSP